MSTRYRGRENNSQGRRGANVADRIGMGNSGSGGRAEDMEIDQDTAMTYPVELTNTGKLFDSLQEMSAESVEKALTEFLQMQEQISQLKVQNENLQQKTETLEKENSDYQKTNKNNMDANKTLQRKLTEAEKNIGELKQYTGELKAKNDELWQQVKIDKSQIKAMGDEVDSLKKELVTCKADKKKTEQDLSDCRSRLSRLIGSKVSDNNPDIADLSDKNRPTKLAERYQELYDNQWTDTFELLAEHCQGVDGDEKDEKCIGLLLHVLKEAKLFCERKSKEQLQELQAAIKLSNKKCSAPKDLDDMVKKQLKDLRKATAEEPLEGLFECFKQEQMVSWADASLRAVSKKQEMQSFVKECVELCWMMTVQDPPVVIGDPKTYTGLFDTNLFKAYTKSGKHYSFVVWPPLYLHEKGPLLGKGVAQGTSRKGDKSQEEKERREKKTTGNNAARQSDKADGQNEPESQSMPGRENEFSNLLNEFDPFSQKTIDQQQKYPQNNNSPSDKDTNPINVQPHNNLQQQSEGAANMTTHQPQNEEIEFTNNSLNVQQPQNAAKPTAKKFPNSVSMAGSMRTPGTAYQHGHNIPSKTIYTNVQGTQRSAQQFDIHSSQGQPNTTDMNKPTRTEMEVFYECMKYNDGYYRAVRNLGAEKYKACWFEAYGKNQYYK